MQTLESTWAELVRWDWKSAQAARFRRDHPDFLPLADYIEDATESINPMVQPDTNFAVYGVSNRLGVFFSHWQKGSAFNQRYKRIKKDWFFHNPTRANIGSIGRVPEVEENAITSPEYQVWKVREGIEPNYLEVLIKSKLLMGLIDIHRVGGVKERLFLGNLLEIPVPTLKPADQATVVAEVSRTRAELTAAAAALAIAESDAGELLLGLVKPYYQKRWGALSAQQEDTVDESIMEP